jgi:methanogenic corrinoid protein MtbC1
VSALVASAMKRLCNEKHAAEISEETQRAVGSPVTAALTLALCDVDDESADLMIADMMAAGVSVEEICLDHLAAAARRLGELWETDRLPFTEVAMAASRIQSIIRRMPPPRGAAAHHTTRGAVFCVVPGEVHTLGAMMAVDLFRRHGWDVGLLLGLEHDEIMAHLAHDDRPVVGLSCSGSHSRPALIRLIEDLRKARPTVHIILSGYIVAKPDLMRGLPRVDACVASFEEAEAEMKRMEASFPI